MIKKDNSSLKSQRDEKPLLLLVPVFSSPIYGLLLLLFFEMRGLAVSMILVSISVAFIFPFADSVSKKISIAFLSFCFVSIGVLIFILEARV